MTHRPHTDTRLFRTLLIGAALIALAGGCSTSDSGAGDLDGLTAFGQFLSSEDDEGDLTPGVANMWDLGRDFAIATGGGGHFDGALKMRVAATAFPSDQNFDGLVFEGPAFGTADGLVPAIVYNQVSTGIAVGEGVFSLSMAPMADARLSQTLNLTSAVPPIMLFLAEGTSMAPSNFSTEPYFVEVLLKDSANGYLQSILYMGDLGTGGLPGADLSPYAGRIVRLFIEARSTPHSLILFDAISVTDADATEFVTNGDFETGDLTGWSRNTPSESRNVTSALRTVGSLETTRSFYTAPDARWARMVDVFTNPTAAQIDETITYEVDLGSDGDGIIYDTPNTMGLAITTWDSIDGGQRDIGWAFGGATSVDYTSDDTLGASGNGNDIMTVTFDISVPAGESVALVNFLVLDTDNTGNGAVDVGDTADVVDAELQAIVAGWPTDDTVNEFNLGLSQAQLDAVENF